MGVDGFAEAWGVRKSRQGANWRAVELFSAQTTYFCQTSCLTHTRTHTRARAHTHTRTHTRAHTHTRTHTMCFYSLL